MQAPDVTNQIWPKLKDIRDKLEPAYRIEPGGAFEESAKGNASIFVLFPVMVMVMLTLLMIQLQSFSRLTLVFLTAPLGIVGDAIDALGMHRLAETSVARLIHDLGAFLRSELPMMPGPGDTFVLAGPE